MSMEKRLASMFAALELTQDRTSRAKDYVQPEDRILLKEQLVLYLQSLRPNAPELAMQKLPMLAAKLECILFCIASTREEYMDMSTLKNRLMSINCSSKRQRTN